MKYFQHEKIDFVSPSGHVLFYYLFYYINTNEIPNHFTETVLSCERRDLLCSHSNSDIFTCENNMLFSRVKISCFRAKAHLVFHWCLYNNSVYPLNISNKWQLALITKWNANVKFFSHDFWLVSFINYPVIRCHMKHHIVFVHVCFTLSLFSIPWKSFSDVSDMMRYDLITNADHLDVATRMSPVTSRRLSKFAL